MKVKAVLKRTVWIAVSIVILIGCLLGIYWFVLTSKNNATQKTNNEKPSKINSQKREIIVISRTDLPLKNKKTEKTYTQETKEVKETEVEVSEAIIKKTRDYIVVETKKATVILPKEIVAEKQNKQSLKQERSRKSTIRFNLRPHIGFKFDATSPNWLGFYGSWSPFEYKNVYLPAVAFPPLGIGAEYRIAYIYTSCDEEFSSLFIGAYYSPTKKSLYIGITMELTK